MRVAPLPSKPELSTWLGVGTFYLAPTIRHLMLDNGGCSDRLHSTKNSGLGGQTSMVGKLTEGLIRGSRSLVLLCVLAIASQIVTRADFFEGVQKGTDWLVTLPGTFVVVNGSTIPMMGNPSFAGGPDTIVQRLTDMVVPDVINSSATTATKMALLALKSTAPVNFGGTFFDIYVDLDPGHATNGTLTFTQTVSGEGIPEGTFSSFFDVFFTIDLTPAGQPKAASVIGANCTASQAQLNGSGSWSDGT